MNITFIYPKMYWAKKTKYAWQNIMPLIYARLKALTPKDFTCSFVDTRFEEVNFSKPTDLVVMSITTMGAKYAYEIADEYRKRGVKVILGGIHVNLIPEEAKLHADSILIGEAELTFPQMLQDVKNGCLKPEYKAEGRYDFKDYKIDKSVYKGKHYFPLHFMETSRGCVFKCNFCSLAPMYNQKITYRDIDNVIEEIKNTKEKFIAFLDENLGNNIKRTTELVKKLKPLKKLWVGQFSLNSLTDPEFVRLLKESNCFYVFIGFETINEDTLKAMNKTSNLGVLKKTLDNCLKYNLPIFCGYINGYSEESEDEVWKAFEYANSFQFINFMTNNLLPFPNTPIYKELESQGRLISEKWWLEDEFLYNHNPLFYNKNIDPKNLPSGLELTKEYFRYKNIFKRFIKSRYKFSTRLLILLINIFSKYTHRVIGN